jgi:hypothetical protein
VYVRVRVPIPVLFFEFTTEREIDPDQSLLLVLAQHLVGQNETGQVGCPIRRLEDAGLDVERLGRDTQCLGDLLQNLCGGSPQSALDLAEIRVRYPGQLRQPPERETSRAALFTDERAQV